MKSKYDLKSVFEQSKNWKIMGDDNHLQVQPVDESWNVIVELNTYNAEFYFLSGDPVSVRIPYSEFEYNNDTKTLRVPSMMKVFPVLNI